MNKFEELGLSELVVSAIIEMGFEQPTPIQEKAIPLLLKESTDLVGLAQTGTGKTAAFGLPLIDLVREEDRYTQALVIAPTRELCLQITSNLQRYAKNKPAMNIVAVYGGANISEQAKQIKRGAQIIIATPGRLIDLLNRKWVRLDQVEYVVLDEADEMLNMGFKEDIDEILQTTPDQKRVWLFSATMAPEIRRIAENYMENPQEIVASPRNMANTNISHQFVVVHPRDKYMALKRFIDYNPDVFGLVFCRTKAETQQVADHLMKDGYNADSLHGDLSQMQRDKVMEKFRDKTLQILVATDVAARGIDVDNITHVFHLSLPDDIEFYTHRSGRTARIGKRVSQWPS
ncbi:MAG: DEAD/DEAH box helicase [Cytophagales bacterium]|nr:DEAD/DEAH box helicase [Cytophagales bacterium]